MSRFNVLGFVLVFLIAGCSSTGDINEARNDPFGMPIDEFKQEHAILRSGLEEGEPRELSEEELAQFDELSDEIMDLVGSATELEDIAPGDRRQIAALRKGLTDVVMGEAEPRRVCFRQHVTGTRLKGVRRCYTLDQINRNRFAAKEIMQYIQNLPSGAHPDS